MSGSPSETDPHPGAAGLGKWHAVRLIATRELTTRLTSKAFKITTAIMLVGVIVIAVIFKLVGSSGPDATVAVVGTDSSIAAPLRASAKAIGQDINTITVSSAQAGRSQVQDGTVDALVTGTGGQLTAVVKKDLGGKLETALDALAGQLALDHQVEQIGGDPAKVHQAVADARVDVQPLEQPYPYNGQQLALGMVAGILIYLSLMTQGQQVAQGVVEEKSSRVVELLLATVRPWQLMAGKVLGIGVVGLIQMILVGIVGVVAGLSLDVLTISVSAAAGTVAWLIVWYLLGFFMYAFAFAAAGALVSRQEDTPSVVMPVLLPVIAGYVIGISVLPSDPSNSICEILSVIPLFAPTLMPMRLAMGGVPGWEAALAVLLVTAMIPLLTWLSGRIYRNAVVRAGARVKLKEALRPA